MALFSRASFSASGYAAFRPSYPPQLYNTILKYHKSTPPASPSGLVLELGCGHGVVARSLAPHFQRVIGLDPSAVMVEQAGKTTQDDKVTFRQGFSHELGFLADKSVEIVVAAQAAHWFDFGKTWPELARVVGRGATLAFWGYKDNILPGHAGVNAIMDEFCYGKGEVAPGWDSMDGYWERPGRDILRNALRDIRPPGDAWTDVKRLVYDPTTTSSAGDAVTEAQAAEVDPEAAWQRKRLRLGELEGYVRTFSAFLGWREAHPDVRSRAEGGEGDIVDVMFDRMLEAEPAWKAEGERWRDVEVESVWGTALILAKRA